MAGVTPASGNPGDLDPAFGTEGLVTTFFPPSISGGANAVAIGPEGAIAAAGRARSFPATDFGVARYLSDGSLDPSFGDGGTVITAVAPGSSGDLAEAVVFQPDGKLLAAGTALMGPTGYDFALVRYDLDGTPDASFGDGGVVTVSIGPGGNDSDMANGVALQPDGKIVAAGLTSTGAVGGYDFAVARFNEDGTLDPDFGDGGKVITSISSGFGRDWGRDVLVDTQGRIVVAGNATGETSPSVFALVRYLADGSLDPDFGDGGKVTTAIGTGNLGDDGYELAIDAHARIVLGGWADTGPPTFSDFAVARYLDDGSLDSTFGSGGTATTPIGPGGNADRAFALSLQDNKPVLAGFANLGSPRRDDFALVRYADDGSPDAEFGTGGIVTTTVMDDSLDVAYGLETQADGKLVAGGIASNLTPPGGFFALARYLAK